MPTIQERKRRRWWLLLLAPPALVVLFITGLLAYDLAIGVYQPYRTHTKLNPDHPELGSEWVMHPVDNPGDWLPNGLDAADVNGDGFNDYVTNYEYRGLVRVAMHPGLPLSDGFWQAFDVGKVANAESSAMGDLDKDGEIDVVIVHGVEHTSEPPAARIYWGLGGPDFAWEDSGALPDSLGGWQFLYIRVLDLDGDDDLDIVCGGRAARLAAEGQRETAGQDANWAGIRWFVNPYSEAVNPRDLRAWTIYTIDAQTPSGHGFEFGDMDGDGDLDLVNGNADWDTPEDEENITWYENPGATSATDAWKAHVVYRGGEFYGKEQVIISDLDDDGDMDILAHVEDAIYWLRNAGDPADLRWMRIEKHPAARWRARPLEAADLNNDGRLDIIGALIHRDGALPKDTAAVFWMEQSPDGWQTRVIKWGDGFRGFGTFNGEKWDQMIPVDVDRDGDLDIVANVEEYNRFRTIIAVVWFENPFIP